jgi:hypothetical protein
MLRRVRNAVAGLPYGNRIQKIINKLISARTKVPVLTAANINKARRNANMKSAIELLNRNLNSKTFFGGVPIAKIGSNSANGAIFAMRMNNGSRKVLKIIHHPLGKSEYSFQNNASKKNISPKVYKLKTGITLMKSNLFFTSRPPNNKINAFLMNNLQKNNRNRIQSLHDFFSTASNANKTIVYNKLVAKVKNLSNISIEHANLHAGNAYVIIKADGTLDVMIIDYGRSRRVGAITRAFGRGNVGQRFGSNVSKYYPGYGKVYERKNNITPVILSKNKLSNMKNYYRIS